MHGAVEVFGGNKDIPAWRVGHFGMFRRTVHKAESAGGDRDRAGGQRADGFAAMRNPPGASLDLAVENPLQTLLFLFSHDSLLSEARKWWYIMPNTAGNRPGFRRFAYKITPDARLCNPKNGRSG
ncbi:hypothetical protein SDC9_204871 [bioreactor metagenome]|uniref:Uncharacterized protein n=1 Tax=bioreactor metagenome TaxID=1076179 RepID=A0A645J196_9ZZZZ